MKSTQRHFFRIARELQNSLIIHTSISSATCSSPLLIGDDVPRSRDPHTLARPNDRNGQQRKHPHDDCEATERNQEAITLDPLAHKESPCKGDDAAQNADDDEAVASELVVRVDELFRKRQCLKVL